MMKLSEEQARFWSNFYGSLVTDLLYDLFRDPDSFEAAAEVFLREQKERSDVASDNQFLKLIGIAA